MKHVGSLAELPTDRVLGIYTYAGRKWNTNHGTYYARMFCLAAEELQKRFAALDTHAQPYAYCTV